MNSLRIAIIAVFVPALMFGNADFDKGLEFYANKKYLSAIGAFKKSIENGFKEAKAYFYLGNAYMLAGSGEYAKALENYRIALENAYESEAFQAVILFQIGYSYFVQKDYTNAVNYFQNAYSINPTLSNAIWASGMAYYNMKNKELTISEWEKYLTVAPTGSQSDNIRKALEILKRTDFKFPSKLDKDIINGMMNPDGDDETKAQENLVDISGVLDSSKPEDKGKAEDLELEDIEK